MGKTFCKLEQTIKSKPDFLFQEFRNSLVSQGTKQANLIKTIERDIVSKSKEFPGYILCDQLAMAAALTKDAVLKKNGPYHVTVELQGHFTRGQMVIDRKDTLKRHCNTYIIEEMDMSVLKKLLYVSMSINLENSE